MMALRSKRILVVGHDSLISLLIADQVFELGYTVVGPACTISGSRNLAEVAALDGAILDVNLNRVLSNEIADILSRRKVLFLFIQPPVVGLYAASDLRQKPFQLINLKHIIEDLLAKTAVEGLVAGR